MVIIKVYFVAPQINSLICVVDLILELLLIKITVIMYFVTPPKYIYAMLKS